MPCAYPYFLDILDMKKEILSIHHRNEVFFVNELNKAKMFYSYKEFVQYVESFIEG